MYDRTPIFLQIFTKGWRINMHITVILQYSVYSYMEYKELVICE